MVDDKLLQMAGRRLEGWQRTMLLSHVRPDGDALGALAALRSAIMSSGRHATACVYDAVPPRYAFLEQTCEFVPWPAGRTEDIDARFDGIVIADTCSWQQLEPVAGYLRASRLPRIVVDHHETRDELEGAGAGAMYLLDATAASACNIIHEWCAAMAWPVDASAAAALLAGIATDTGWFRFSNTDGRTLRAASALLEKGVRPDWLYAQTYESYSQPRLRLKAEALATLGMHAGGRLAMMVLPQSAFARAGATQADTEDLVNEPLSAKGVAVSIMLTEQPDGRVRANFRSRTPDVVGVDVDVAAMASAFGGGGHRRAAGARLDGPIEEACRRVLEAALARLNECGR